MMIAESVNNTFGRTVNPLNRKLTSGGSSGGESALISFGGSLLGVGTDIGELGAELHRFMAAGLTMWLRRLFAYTGSMYWYIYSEAFIWSFTDSQCQIRIGRAGSGQLSQRANGSHFGRH